MRNRTQPCRPNSRRPGGNTTGRAEAQGQGPRPEQGDRQPEEPESQYNKARKEANAKQATLRDQLAAQQAKTALATKCAQVMATGMQIIYNATTPEQVMNDVTKEMNRAAASCDGVVNVG